MSTRSPVRVTALYRSQLRLGARFRDEAAWRIADVYTSVDEERESARGRVGMSDVSGGGKLGVRGADAATLIAKVTGESAPAVGRATRARLNGAEVLVGRVAPDELLTLSNATDAAGVHALVTRASESLECAHCSDLTSVFAALDIVGPLTLSVLEKLVPLDLSPRAVPPLGVVLGELVRVRAILIRLDHPRLPAFRVLIPRECGEFVWASLHGAGADLGLVTIGAAAHRMLMAED